VSLPQLGVRSAAFEVVFNSARSGLLIDRNTPNPIFVFQRRGQAGPDGRDTAGRAAEKQRILGSSAAINRLPANGVCQETACSKVGPAPDSKFIRVIRAIRGKNGAVARYDRHQIPTQLASLPQLGVRSAALETFFNSARSDLLIDRNTPNPNFVFQRRCHAGPAGRDAVGRAAEKQTILGSSAAIGHPLTGFVRKRRVQKLGPPGFQIHPCHPGNPR